MRSIPRLRWWIVALISCGTIANYIARNSLGALAPELKTTMAMTTEQYSYVVGAFQLAYTVMQPIAGYIVDHFGLRVGFALFAIVWSVANMMHALAGGWVSLAFFRGLLGMSEAAAIPSGMKAIAEWFPARERSVATGFFNAGTSFGAVLAPAIVFGVIWFGDWRLAFVVTGAIGLVWAAAWYAFYRSPAEHPAITPDELALITADRPAVPARKASALQIVGSARFWVIAVPRFLAEPAWQTFSFFIPLYLARQWGMDLTHSLIFTAAMFVAADLGGIFGGFLSPILMRQFGMEVIRSRVVGFALAAALMIAPGCVGLAPNPYAAVVLLCIGGFAHQIISVLINTLSADVFTPAEVGTANGFVGQAGWIGGLLFTLLVGQLADRIGYSPLFAALGVFDLIGAVILIVFIRRLTLPLTESPA